SAADSTWSSQQTSLFVLSGMFFFFQAEDGIRDLTVTGVQTCALPILLGPPAAPAGAETYLALTLRREADGTAGEDRRALRDALEIGRASCREREGEAGGGGALNKKGEHRSKPGDEFISVART